MLNALIQSAGGSESNCSPTGCVVAGAPSPNGVNAAELITSDCDNYGAPFPTGERTTGGFYQTKAGIDQAVARSLADIFYTDLPWCETRYT